MGFPRALPVARAAVPKKDTKERLAKRLNLSLSLSFLHLLVRHGTAFTTIQFSGIHRCFNPFSERLFLMSTSNNHTMKTKERERRSGRVGWSRERWRLQQCPLEQKGGVDAQAQLHNVCTQRMYTVYVQLVYRAYEKCTVLFSSLFLFTLVSFCFLFSSLWTSLFLFSFSLD
jgi:hypothetical protein